MSLTVDMRRKVSDGNVASSKLDILYNPWATRLIKYIYSTYIALVTYSHIYITECPKKAGKQRKEYKSEFCIPITFNNPLKACF